MAITDLIPIPSNINPGVHAAKQSTMLALLGNPRGSYSQECQSVTNPVLSPLMISDSVGPFRVTGLLPAVESLKTVMDEIRQAESQIHKAIGTAGMLCARYVRGSSTSISNHSWGTAIDITLNGKLDIRGDGKVQSGLARIAPIFNRHGWFWGAAFGTEDGMHFEVCDEKIREWHIQGLFSNTHISPPAPVLTVGDRGPEVKKLQEKLNALGAGLDADGVFGQGTFAAVVAFQSSRGLDADGVVGKKTWEALGRA